jgi:ABC-type bacteriocin/lantibiotic exporter with double-glycine peptidase domain
MPALSSGKTAVLIPHRFSSARMADRILVLADGTVEAASNRLISVKDKAFSCAFFANSESVALRRSGSVHLCRSRVF